MPSIDERIVAMSFENAKFEAGVAKTLGSLNKLDQSLKKIGSTQGLGDIQKAADKINFNGLTTALDKLKAKFTFGNEAKSLNDIDAASKKITFSTLGTALDSIKTRFATFATAAGNGLNTLRDKLLFKGASTGFLNIENASRQVKLQTPIAATEKVRANLKFPGAEAAFANIEKASGRVKLAGVSQAVQSISTQFSAMSVVATTALATVSHQAVVQGGRIAKAISVGPLVTGFQEYSTNLQSIQTILANTKASGADLQDVNKALQELNRYSDQTIYNFAQMAKNIGTFTAAGVDLETATGSIKGIANLAALSGSSAEQASTAMYQLSQAIAAGRVSLQDWNSVVNAGMGGTVFQRALAQTAVAMGKIDESAVKLSGKMKNVKIDGESFRESISAKPGQESWLTSDVLTKTLQQFTGDLSEAELAAQGFNEAQIKAIQETAKTAKLAATEVKTITQVFDVAKETMGSGWAKTFQTIFGDFEEAKSTFTGLSNTINGFINKNADARNKVLADWAALGGRKVLIDGITNAFEALGSVIKPIKEAFRDIFPAKTGQDLFNLTVKFRDFMANLKIGPETADRLKRTFKGFFAILSIGKGIVQGIFSVLADLLGAAGKGSGGFLEFTGSIGDWLVKVDSALKKGDKLKKFFDAIGEALASPIKLLGDLGSALIGLFGGEDSSAGISKSFEEMGEALGPLSGIVDVAKVAWSGFLEILQDVKDFLGPMVQEIADTFGQVGDAITKAFEDMDFDKVFEVIQTTLIGGILLTLRKALGGGLNIEFGGKGFFDSLNDTMGLLNKNLLAIQRNIQASTMLKIAAAVGILAASATALSLVDPKRLASAMTAMAAGLGQLVGAMALITKMGGGAGLGGMIVMIGHLNGIALGLILIASAMTILTVPILVLSRLKWEELAKGLSGIGGALAAIGLALKTMPPSGLIAIGAALVPISLSLIAISAAMKIFATMKWEEIAKGLLGVGGGLAAIGIGVRGMGPSLILVGPGLIAVGFGLNLLAAATKSFAGLDLGELGKGLLGIAGSLTAVGLAIGLIPPTIALQAAGLVILSVALTGIAVAMKLFGGMDISTIAKGLSAMGLALVVFAGGLTLMSGTIPGSLALLAAASAIAILVPAIGILGKMKLKTIAVGLAAIGAAILTIGAAGGLVAPGLLAAGVAFAAIGAGTYLAGKGVSLLATGLTKLGGEGSKGLAVIIAALTAFIALLPKIIIDFVKGLVTIVAEVAKIAPQIVQSFVKITNAVMDGIIQASPKIAAATIALLGAMLKVINDKAPELIQAGWKLLLAFLKGIEDHIGDVVTTSINIIRKILASLTGQFPKLLASGAKALGKFLEGIASKLPELLTSAAKVVTKFIEGVTKNIPKVVPAAAKMVAKFLNEVANQVPKIITAGVRIVTKFLEGIGNNLGKVATAGTRMVKKLFDAAVKAALGLIDAGVKAAIQFIHGVADGIRENSGEMGEAGADIGAALVEGMIKGIGSMAGALINRALKLISDLPNKVKKFLKIKSPSQVFQEIGVNVVKGMVVGLGDTKRVNRAGEAMADNLISSVKKVMGITSPSKVMEELGKFVVQGFAKGIRGNTEDIKSAFADMNQKIKDAMAVVREDIAQERQKMQDVGGDDGILTTRDLSAIMVANTALREHEKALSSLKRAQRFLVKDLSDEQKQLTALAAKYAKVGEQLTAAQDVLKQATQTRNDAFLSISQQYSTLPGINTDARNQLAAFTTSIKKQIDAVAAYSNTLEALRKLGLDDALYKKLVDEGTVNQKFADQLLAGGATAVQGVNALNQQLATVSAKLGKNAALNMYQAGVDAAQGVVKGLESQMAAITKQMEKIAKAMIKALKKELKIKSPSEEFRKLALLSAEGLVKGFDDSGGYVDAAAASVGDSALEAMRKSMTRAVDILGTDPAFNPVVTPVLDLTQAQKDAQKLAALTNVTPITAAASFNQAASISAAQAAAAQSVDSTPGEQSVTEVKFEQNNFSPKALTATEIYRQTKNQLAQVKGGIPLAS